MEEAQHSSPAYERQSATVPTHHHQQHQQQQQHHQQQHQYATDMQLN